MPVAKEWASVSEISFGLALVQLCCRAEWSQEATGTSACCPLILHEASPGDTQASSAPASAMAAAGEQDYPQGTSKQPHERAA